MQISNLAQYFISNHQNLTPTMGKSLLAIVILLAALSGMPGFSQSDNEPEPLGLPGDNLDLYAVLDLFQKSKTIEDFQRSLNDSATGINNLDLNLDGKVDFIKVETKQKDQDFTFILQVDVTEKETQDVAVILVSKDKDNKITMQVVGDKELYGKNYVVEPKPPTPPVTPNPGYTGTEPVKESVPGSTTVVVVESVPVVQYIYSPAYVPYTPPYYYGYYPPYFAAFTVMAVGIYRHNNYYHHYPYHGGYGGTVVVHNTNNYNNYNNSRNTSNTVNHNNASGKYQNSGSRPSSGSGNRPSTTPATRQTNPSASTRPANPSASNRQSNPSASTRQASPSASTGRQAPRRPPGRQAHRRPPGRQAHRRPPARLHQVHLAAEVAAAVVMVEAGMAGEAAVAEVLAVAVAVEEEDKKGQLFLEIGIN